jgi:hypothetical protein
MAGMIGKKDEITKSNGRHPQRVVKITPPRLMNRRAVDSGTSGTQAGFLFLSAMLFLFGCVGGILLILLVR